MNKNIKILLTATTCLIVLTFPKIGLSNSTKFYDEYGTTKNINQYINEVSTRSTGNGDLELSQAKAIEECSLYVINKNYAIIEIANLRTNGGKYADLRIAALQDQSNRCKDFSFISKLKSGDVTALFDKAAAQGNVEAIAHNIAWGTNVAKLSQKKAKEIIISIINSGNASALFAIAPLMEDGDLFRPTVGKEVGTPISTYAWQLVACDHGVNCSASSPVTQQMCLSLGLCGPGDFRFNLQSSAVTPSDYAQIVLAEKAINSSINSGTVQNFLNLAAAGNSP